MPKSKKNSSKLHAPSRPSSTTAPTLQSTRPVAEEPSDSESNNPVVLFTPEQLSLDAHQQIQNYLQRVSSSGFSQEDLNAVLRLSQHLRVFGLLSSVGYLNQTNDQQGNVRQRTVPVWHSLIGDFLEQSPIDLHNAQQRRELMNGTELLARSQPNEYFATWRRSMILAQHWNFWARAYKIVN